MDPDVTHPELLQHLFGCGAELLMRLMPDILAGRGRQMAAPQDESRVIHAAKVWG